MQFQYIFLFSAERLLWTLGQVSWLGGAERALRPLHLPRPLAEWSFEAASSLTVAGPRRIFTGLPC
jgi:hypothetical protein